MRTIRLAIAIAALTAGTAAFAQTRTAASSSGAGVAVTPGAYTYGYRFTVVNELQVTAIGWYDVGGDGLASSHQVGIWSVTVNGTNGGQLADEVVPAGTAGFEQDGYRYVQLATPLTLTPGSYIIGGYAPGDDIIRYPTGTRIDSEGVVVTQGRTNGGGEGYSYPRLAAAPNASYDPGLFGPNFQYTGGTPEPSAWALMIGGFALAGAAARRRRRRVTAAA